MAAFGLCMYCYGVSIYTMPVFLLASCIYLLASGKVSAADVLLSAAVYLLVAWPFIAVMAINFFRWDTVETPLFTLPFFPDSVRAGDILFFSPYILSQLGENIRALLRVTVLQGKDLPWNDVQDFGTMYLFSAPFVAQAAGGDGRGHPGHLPGNRHLVRDCHQYRQCEPLEHHLLSDHDSDGIRHL